MTPIYVHQATIFDLESLVILFDSYRQFHGCEPNPGEAREFLRDRLNHGESALFLASEEQQPIGFAQLYPTFSSLSLARTFFMDDLYVLPTARRRGAALRLMTAAVDYASAIGAEKISLSLTANNTSARAMYDSTGWTLEERNLVYHFMVPEMAEAAI